MTEDVNLNLRENVDMTFIDLDASLCDELVIFLKENFNVDDVNALSDKDYHELYEKICQIEVHEASIADDGDGPMSEYGNNVTDVVTYMGNQFIEGGRRWRGDKSKSLTSSTPIEQLNKDGNPEDDLLNTKID